MKFERYSRASSSIVPLSKSPFKSRLPPGLTRDSVGTVGADTYTYRELPQAAGGLKGAEKTSPDLKASGNNEVSYEEFEDKAVGERPPSWLETVRAYFYNSGNAT